MNNRVKSFLWRWGAFVAISGGAYLTNIGDIREVDVYKLITIFVVVSAGYVVNEATKYLNTPNEAK